MPMWVREVDSGDLVLLSQSTCVVSLKGAGALGHVTGAFTVQWLFVKYFPFFLFFFFRDRYSGNTCVASLGLSKCWFNSCSH